MQFLWSLVALVNHLLGQPFKLGSSQLSHKMYKIVFSAHSHQLSILTGFPDYKLVGKLVIFFSTSSSYSQKSTEEDAWDGWASDGACHQAWWPEISPITHMVEEKELSSDLHALAPPPHIPHTHPPPHTPYTWMHEEHHRRDRDSLAHDTTWHGPQHPAHTRYQDDVGSMWGSKVRYL